jgi:hypothetical protein
MTAPGYIYALQLPDNRIKVGVTKHVKQRFATYSTLIPDFIVLLVEPVLDMRGSERRVHSLLHEHRCLSRRELFDAPASLVCNTIRSVV